MIRTYSELSKLKTFDERFEYLKLDGIVGRDTFGFDRFLNQHFYRSKEWRLLRDHVIARDLGGDMGLVDYPINGKIIIHHMNPISIDDLLNRSDYVVNPEYLISVSHITHNALHYGDRDLIQNEVVERQPNDTCPWKR